MRNLSLKGFSGRVCCGLCKNVLGRCTPFDDDEYLVHLFSPEYERFDKHTLDSYCEAAAHLKHVAESTPGRLLEEEKNICIPYSPEGVLWDPEVFARLSPQAASTQTGCTT